MTSKALERVHGDIIEEMRRLARESDGAAPDVLALRRRRIADRAQDEREWLETLATQGNIDWAPIADGVRRREEETRRAVVDVLTRLEAQAAERVKAHQAFVHRVRAQYLETFGAVTGHTPASQIKFRTPFSWWSDAHPGVGHDCRGWPWFEPHSWGPFDATAELRVEDTGVWFHPFIKGENGHCRHPDDGRTVHEVIYHLRAPATTFAVQQVRVDLIGNGVASGHLGSLFPLGFALGYGSSVRLDVRVAQQVGNEWHHWPLVSDYLFSETDDYVREIRLVLSGQTYPVHLRVRSPQSGGGDLLCFLHLACGGNAAGRDGYVRLDFAAPDRGIFVGGVALLGASETPALEQ